MLFTFYREINNFLDSGHLCNMQKNLRCKINTLKKNACLMNNMAAELKSLEITDAQELILILEQLLSKTIILARKLDDQARLENLNVYMTKVKRPVKKHEIRIYSYWYASWRVNSKIRNVCLGSTKDMTRDEAFIKARMLKAESLSIRSY